MLANNWQPLSRQLDLDAMMIILEKIFGALGNFEAGVDPSINELMVF